MFNNPLGYADDGSRVPIEHFNYDAIDPAEFDIEPEELKDFSPANLEDATKLLRTVLTWVWSGGINNIEGLQIRAMIVCWIFLERLKPLTETELAKIFGKDKQSVGRWVEEWKKAYPTVHTPHMKV